MTVNVYVNEESLQGQLCAKENDGVKQLIDVLRVLRSFQGVDVKLYYSKTIFNKLLCADNGYTLHNIKQSNRDLYNDLIQNLNRAVDWKTSQLQNPAASYTCNGQSVNGTSVAEVYERPNPQETSILLNCHNSTFADPVVDVFKNGTAVHVHSLSTCDVASEFIHSLGIVPAFNRKSNEKVLDEQTILSDTNLFSPTPYYNHHRRVYQRKGKNEYWCADNMHRGGSVHLEVFDKNTGKFKGTCEIDDMGKFRPLDRNRHINLQKHP